MNCTEPNGAERLRSSPKTPISETKSVDGNTAETIVASEPSERCKLKTNLNWYDNNAIDYSATAPTTSSVDEKANETKNCTESNGTKHVRSSPKTPTSKTKPVNVNTAKSTVARVPSDDSFESIMNLNWHDDNTMDSSASAPTTSAVAKGTNETTNCTASNGTERLRSSPKTPASETKSVDGNTAETIVASEPSKRCELKTNLNWYDDNAIDYSAIAPTTSSVEERANKTKECTGSEKSEGRTEISRKDSRDMDRSEETGATESRACICTEDEKFAATTSQGSSIVDLLDEGNLLMSQNSNAEDEEEPEARMELQIPTTPDGSSNRPKYRSETSALDAHRTYMAVNTVTTSELTTKVRIRNIRQLAKEEVLDGKALKRSRKRPNDRNAYEIEDTPQRDLAVTSCNVFGTTAAAKDASSEFSSPQTPEKSSTESGSASPDCHVPRYCVQKAACAPQGEPSLPKKNRRRRIFSEDSSDETDDESLGKKKEKRDKKRKKHGTEHRGYRSSEKYHTSEDIARLARSVNAKWEQLWKRTAALATSMARSDDGVPVRMNKLTIPAADEDNMVTLVPGGRFSRSCVARAVEAKWMRKRMNILVEDFWPLEQRCKLTLMMKKPNTEYRTITKKEIDILTEAAKILERTHPLNDGDIDDSRAVRTWISAKIKSDRNRLSRIGSTSNESRSGTDV